MAPMEKHNDSELAQKNKQTHSKISPEKNEKRNETAQNSRYAY
jgi:hypothetical protein